MPGCKFPKCNHAAEGTWALVDLCGEHREAISNETNLYYRKKINQHQRYLYHQISWLISWSREASE
ncbi:hypothetical protein SAMN05661091_4090 [Paenibacillus uliginis N3/975]|uniref:Uncharacterized protein n=1 Tax=Paenibacillus uliginis N3/975 TaxID=1313296 RepID=A0A1X7HLX9_9BACL|nr:hypothetical protein [Paenibacillus uliginis]SMF88061.1 hypothetical protein SAMN05661091_4090 [Paenibacillus uliginis N3/975]